MSTGSRPNAASDTVPLTAELTSSLLHDLAHQCGMRSAFLSMEAIILGKRVKQQIEDYQGPAEKSPEFLLQRLLSVSRDESRQWDSMGLRLESIANKLYPAKITRHHPTQMLITRLHSRQTSKMHPTQEVGLRESSGPPDLRISELEVPKSEQEDSEPRLVFRNSITDAESMKRSGTSSTVTEKMEEERLDIQQDKGFQAYP